MKKSFFVFPLAAIAILLGSALSTPVVGQETATGTGIVPQFEQPLLITSAGQSAEIQLASVLAKKAGLAFTIEKTATASDLGEAKTLALVLGTSLKGLGAAGLDVSKEKERVDKLLAEARKKNIPILCLHLGGESRRGQLTDDFISTYLPYAQKVIIVKSANHDGIFTRICEEKKILLVEVEKTADVVAPLKESFNQENPGA